MNPSHTATRACALALLLWAGFSAAQAQHDRRHDSYRHYPQPGWAVHSAPAHSRVVLWGGVNYRYHDSVWYAPGARGYVVVRPPLGLVFRERPAFATVVGLGALAYLVANGVYYRELRGGGYEVVAPPAEEPQPAAALQPAKTFVYPRLNQTAEQQASDEYECHQWATQQSGFDPTAVATGLKAGPAAQQRDNYQRATNACLEGRGYTVR
jgi:hypothetical protein